MSASKTSRRGFLQTSAAVSAAAAATPYLFTAERSLADDTPKSANERPLLACIGTGSRWGAVGPNALQFADCVAVCDVDANHRDGAKARVEGIQKKAGRDRTIETFEDYRKILDNKDIEVVTLSLIHI